MATCKAVVVLCPNGRKVNVKIAPNATIVKILEEACRKQGLNAKQYRVKHQRKLLDNDLSMRFSNLPNNAHLELVQETGPAKQGSSCTVALQLESGERLLHSFQSSSTLWEILSHWDSQKERENEDRLTERKSSDESLVPVCVYMTEEIQGAERLKSTTLESIGLSSGRAVIRLSHRKVSGASATSNEHSVSSNTQQHQEENNKNKTEPQNTGSDSQTDKKEQLIDTQDRSSPNGTTVTKSNISEKVDETSKTSEDMEVVSHTAASGSSSHGVDSVTKNQTRPSGSGEPSTITPPDTCYEEDIPAIDFKAMLAEEREKLIGRRQEQAQQRSQAGESRSAKRQILDRHTGSSHPRSALPKRPRLERLPEPLFPNFKFPDGKPEQERGGVCPSSDPDFVQGFSCERQSVVYSLDDQLAQGSDQEDLPDEFFEVTVDDLRRMLNQLNQDRMKQESAPLLTKSQREAAEKAQMERYTKVVIRVYFPDRLVLQGFFRPNEKVSAITEFVRDNLENPKTDFYIYVAPPKRILSKLDINIYEAKLCPAAVVYFGSEEKKDHFLAEQHMQTVSSLVAAEQAVHREMSCDRKQSSTSVEVTSQAATSSQTRTESGPSTSTNRTPASAGTSAGKPGAVPKWFKMGKK